MAARRFVTTATQVIGEATGLISPEKAVKVTLRSGKSKTEQEKGKQEEKERREKEREEDKKEEGDWTTDSHDEEIGRAATQVEQEIEKAEKQEGEVMDETVTSKRQRSATPTGSAENSPAGKKAAERLLQKQGLVVG